jgi:hypothetical protein
MGTSSKALAEKLRKLAPAAWLLHRRASHRNRLCRQRPPLPREKRQVGPHFPRHLPPGRCPGNPAARCMAALLWTRDKDGLIKGFDAKKPSPPCCNTNSSPEPPSKSVFPKGSGDLPSFRPDLLSFVRFHSTKPQKWPGLPRRGDAGDPAPPAAAAPTGGRLPDYYDWLDYQAVLCARDPDFFSFLPPGHPGLASALYFRLDGDRLWLQAEQYPLVEILEQFARAGVDVRFDPRIQLHRHRRFSRHRSRCRLESLLAGYDYLLTWKMLRGPLGRIPKLQEIQVFTPGSGKAAARPMPKKSRAFDATRGVLGHRPGVRQGRVADRGAARHHLRTLPAAAR